MTTSPNLFLNATLALIRGDISTAREIFRSPTSGIENVAVISTKIFEELERLRRETLIKHLTEILRQSMTLSSPVKEPTPIESLASSFDRGVIAVEQIINKMILDLSHDRSHNANPAT